MVSLLFEERLLGRGIQRIAGVDEAGRGPLAGPVVAAAVVFDPAIQIDGVDDSKKLSATRREELYERIFAQVKSIGIGIVSSRVIDEMNIYRASMRAMELAVDELSPRPGHLLIDGPRYHNESIPYTAIVDGDALSYTIAAASIVAKVTRDRLMRELHQQYPEYGFDKHKGYGTRQHIDAIRKYGPCPEHRKSFRMPGREG